MNDTQIEYAQKTLNILTGCLRRCPYCYGLKLANGRLKKRYLANKNVIAGDPEDPYAIRWWPERLDEIGQLKKPTRIFLCNMSDLFGDAVPPKYVLTILDAVRAAKQHTFILLTKYGQNLPQYSPFSDNCWVGMTATNREQYSDAIDWLNFVQAGVKFISFEPLLEEVGVLPDDFLQHNIRWTIIGAQTNPTIRPSNKAMQQILVAAKRAGTAVFCKGNLARKATERAKLPVLCRERRCSLILREEYPL
jgi:protein gp37